MSLTSPELIAHLWPWPKGSHFYSAGKGQTAPLDTSSMNTAAEVTVTNMATGSVLLSSMGTFLDVIVFLPKYSLAFLFLGTL